MSTTNPDFVSHSPSAESAWDLRASLAACLHVQQPAAPDTAIRLRPAAGGTRIGWAKVRFGQAA